MGARGMIAGLGVESWLVDIGTSFHLLDSQFFFFFLSVKSGC